MNKASRLLVVAIILITASLAPAQSFDEVGVQIEARPAASPAGLGGSGELIVSITVPFGYSITDVEGVFDIQVMEEVEGLTFGQLVKPEPDHVDEVGGHFEGSTDFKLPFQVEDGAELGEREITLGFRLQVCDLNTGICLIPTNPADLTKTVVVEIAKESAAPVRESSTAATTSGEGSLEDLFASALGGGNLLFAFAIAFIAGIITSLTPCVYPMIPITMAYVSGRSQGDKRNGFFVSLVLVLGIAITYSILGLIAGSVGSTFGSYMNHPVVQIVLLIIFVALGLSFLGVWEIALPSSVTNKAATQKKGYMGALLIGLTLGIVAAPCVGPVLIAMLLFIAEQGDLLTGFLLMFVYAIGMGLLFIVVGTFSNAILPKSGNWMNWMKRVFAFLFFIMGVWYAQSTLELIFPDLPLYLYGILFVLWGGSIGAFFKLEKDAGGWEIIGKGVGILFVAIGVVLVLIPVIGQFDDYINLGGGASALPADTGGKVSWRTDYEAAMAEAAEQGKPVIVDFWATWCKECKRLESETFNAAPVAAELDRFVRIKVDGTSEDDPYYSKIREIYQEKGHRILGLPAVFLHDSSGEIVTVVNRFEDVATFLPKLEAVD